MAARPGRPFAVPVSGAALEPELDSPGYMAAVIRQDLVLPVDLLTGERTCGPDSGGPDPDHVPRVVPGAAELQSGT